MKITQAIRSTSPLATHVRANVSPLPGLIAFGLTLVAIILQASQGGGGVDPGASPGAIAAAYTVAPTFSVWAGAYLQVLALMSLGVFLVSLVRALPTGEHDRLASLRSTASAFAMTFVALTLAGFAVGGLARFRAGSTADISALVAVVDVHVALYIASWAALGVAMLAMSALILQGGGLPRWSGWTAAAIGILALLAVAIPQSPLASLPNLLVLLWAAAQSAVVRRRPSALQES
jgi:uncharacterized membrane protein YqgA involved in biofilm formation